MSRGRPDAVRAARWIATSAREGSLCLVLGAGVNVDIGGLKWGQLLEALADARARRVLDSFAQYDPAFAIELLVQRDSNYFRRLRRALYPPHLPADWTTTQSAGPRARFSQGTLNPLGRLAIAIGAAQPERGFHIITYNYDTLLEEVIATMGHRALAVAPAIPDGALPVPGESRPLSPTGSVVYDFKPVASPERYVRRSGGQGPVTVRVVHPHGVVRRRGHSLGVVLSGKSYDWSARNQFEPHNLWQLAAFAGLRCLFYGLSFGDIAIRRLIRLGRALQTSPDNVMHFALLPRENALLGERLRARLGDLGVATVLTDSFCQQRQVLTRALQLAE